MHREKEGIGNVADFLSSIAPTALKQNSFIKSLASKRIESVGVVDYAYIPEVEDERIFKVRSINLLPRECGRKVYPIGNTHRVAPRYRLAEVIETAADFIAASIKVVLESNDYSEVAKSVVGDVFVTLRRYKVVDRGIVELCDEDESDTMNVDFETLAENCPEFAETLTSRIP